MKRGTRKHIYMVGAVIIAVVVFLCSLFFVDIHRNEIFILDSTISSSHAGQSIFEPDNSSMEESSSDFDGGGAGDSSGGGSSEGMGGGGSSEDSGGGGAADPMAWFTILTDVSQRVYLFQNSMGAYTGKGEHGFSADKKYYLENASDVNPLYYFGFTMQSSGATANRAQIELIRLTNDLLPYSTISKQGEVNQKQYTVDYYVYDYFTDGIQGLQPFIQDTRYIAQEQAYREFVYQNYLAIPSDLQQTLLGIAEENDIYSTSQTVIEDVVYYIRNAAYYDFEYVDKNYPSDKDMVTYFLTEYKRGVCRHFAAAATMMFRALGIPARYVMGFAVDVEANVKLEYSGAGHAWTEIYLDGYGWIPLEVTGSNIYWGATV